MTDNGTPLTVGQHIMATPPLGHRRLCRVDRVHSDGLVVLSFARPRGKGRCAWATDVRWLTPVTAA
ncbi:MAG: hypothetical protein KDB26_15460 [Microthrixaceae bacterium]|nr:hypothetical protein [Microthrixaceae bacterium]